MDHKMRLKVIQDIREELLVMLNLEEINDHDNLIQQGLSSIMVMKISGKLRKNRIKVPFAKLIENPTFELWTKLICKAEIRSNISIANNVVENKEFDLTDVQYAYWVGREDEQNLGGIGCHAYIEFDGENVSKDKLRRAWCEIQRLHPMLRAKFLSNGKQVIMDKPYCEDINIYNFEEYSTDEVNLKLKGIREKLSHRKLDVGNGEVAGITLSLLPNNKSRIHIDIDLLVADVQSLSIVIRDLSEIYNGKKIDIESKIDFSNYLLEKHNNIDAQQYENDKLFWKNKIAKLSKDAVNIPLQKKPEQIERPIFSRRRSVINKESWNKIKQIASSNKLTPSMVLLTSYALILERWCNQEELLINIPLFDRNEEDKVMQNMVADFTNLLLLDFRRKTGETFIETANRVRNTFIENVSHSSYSGVKVQRDIYKEIGGTEFVAPLVFACNLDTPLETDLSRHSFGDISFMISQTPQVWLDFQIYIKDGNVILCWDAVDELYPDGMIDDMFNALILLIVKLETEDNWNNNIDVLPISQKLVREDELNKIVPLEYPNKLLYTDFLVNVENNPEKIALIDATSGLEMSYKQVFDEAIGIANILHSSGINSGDYIGLTLPRGYKQILSILGIMFAGGVYVPISINQPSDRRNKIYKQIGLKAIVSDTNTIRDLNLDTVEILVLNIENKLDDVLRCPLEKAPNDSAYIIMTSGSTGTPKGVEICHNSAMNTINDLNNKYNITKKDTVLMVSAIDFDLSVYDIFGLLSVGGSIIVLDEDNYKDPHTWIKLIEKFNVSIWNSVPILFDMLVTIAEGLSKELPIRIAMLSGDWINIDLPSRFYEISKQSTVVAMGGATEASIWSNFINVPKSIPNSWISIPYGRPLDNQVYKVVDGLGRIAPNYVPGELWIGGVGVAKGYKGDQELTSKKFVYDIVPWYKTGDIGRIWNDGTIEFLGRKDNQVKIKGHRIEIGEIEDAIKNYPGIKNAVVDITMKSNEDKKLIAFIEVDANTSDFYIKENTVKFVDKLNMNYYKSSDIKEKFENFIKYSNIICCKFIMNYFNKNNIFTNSSTKYSYRNIIETLNVDSEKIEVINRWLDIFLENNIIENNSGYRVVDSYSLVTDISEDTTYTKTVSKYCEILGENIDLILSGKKDAIEVFYNNGTLLTNNLLETMPGNNEFNTYMVNVIEQLIIQKKSSSTKVVRILEIGTRNIHFTKTILDLLSRLDIKAKYVYTDNSIYYKNDIESLKNKYNFMEFQVMNFDVSKDSLITDSTYDVIIASNSLHRSDDLNYAFGKIINLLNPKGILIGSEFTIQNYLQDISALILEDGFKNKKDFRAIKKIGTPNKREIEDLFADRNDINRISFKDNENELYGNTVFLGIKNETNFPMKLFEKYLEDKLPKYMIPSNLYKIEKLPITNNGKLDRKVLKEILRNEDIHLGPRGLIKDTKTELRLKSIWRDIFGNSDVQKNDNYFYLGGDSLVATKLITIIKKEFSVDVSIRNIFENPNIESLGKFIDGKEVNLNYSDELVIIPDSEHIYEPFPLTDVQYAYWIGRSGLYNLGNVSTHCYFELDCKSLDIPKLENILNNLISKHEMMRVVILDDGNQRILKDIDRYFIHIDDYSHLSRGEKIEKLHIKKLKLSSRKFDFDSGLLFEFNITILDDMSSKLHISFDNIIFDGWSMFMILNELSEKYNNVYKEENHKLSFRDYALAINSLKKTKKYQYDKEYWQERIKKLSMAPKLPLAKSESDIEQQTFTRRSNIFNYEEWKSLKDISKKIGVTPSVLIMSAFAETLRLWSLNDDFTLNLTQFDRKPLHKDVDKIIGDFTTLTLLEVKNNGENFRERALNIQKQLSLDLEHSLFSGIEVERELRKIRGESKQSIMPIVFTSGLGIEQWRPTNWIGELSYMISQTPQVWLDHQVVEINGNLMVSWDSVDELFPRGMLDDMFSEYIRILKKIIVDSDIIYKKHSSIAYIQVSNERNKVCNTNNISSKDWDKFCEKKSLQDKEFYILNSMLKPCPDEVAGRLFVKVSSDPEYEHNKVLENYRLVYDNNIEALIYDTGYSITYCSDSNIKFLGKTIKEDSKAYSKHYEIKTDINSKKSEKELSATELNSDTEIFVWNIWKEILGCEFDIKDNFFHAGGDSLKVVKVINEVNKKFNCEIKLKDLFDEPTIEGFSRYIDSKIGDLSYEEGEI